MSKKFLLRPLALAALLAATGAAQAAITVYTDQASFLAAVDSSGMDDFNDLPSFGATPSPLNRSAGDFGYVVDATDEFGVAMSFFGAGTMADPWLSTDIAEHTIGFYGFTGGVGALGGNFFGSNIAGGFELGSLTLTATDADGSHTEVMLGASTESFLGFVSSTGSLDSVTLASVAPDVGTLWPAANNLILASVVPEPETYGLMLAGLAFVGFVARRRRA